MSDMKKNTSKKTRSALSAFSLIILIITGLLTTTPAEAVTVATFADPGIGATGPIFNLDLITNRLTGTWDDSKTGLTLNILGTEYEDSFFTIADGNGTPGLNYNGDVYSGQLGSGSIKFFADGLGGSALLQIDFNSARLSYYGFGGTNQLSGNGVVISGSQVGSTISDESFSFCFGNQQPIGGDWNDGYTATAGFTCSAVVPEPATIGLLGGLAGLFGLGRRRHAENRRIKTK